ncbi:IS110 family transposase [Clostridium sp. Marseille-P299]|uniref:IS110 family transposase n=1 Tax=Clostridium sp. Marseille-P299 TaxID=1805477 RepID=UPI000835B0FF|nr:IS110 family transposase [Clostridium sp. Marseille-P299]
MNYTQNKKIEQVTESTLVIGTDIGSEFNYVRAFDWRGIELTKKVFSFSNTKQGYINFLDWVHQVLSRTNKKEIIVGCEPTGHYWFTFAKYVKEQGMKLVFVNPFHVHQSKEMDDNSPKKTDMKDPKTIAKLVVEGRYSLPYVPEGVYADLRTAVSSRDRILKEINAATNRIKRWLKIYFPEYLEVYKVFDSISGILVLERAPMPRDVISLGTEGINKIWREAKVRRVGMKRAQTLVVAAHNSVGINGGSCAKLELQLLLEDYQSKKNQLEKITQVIEEETLQIDYVEQLLSIKGVGLITVAGFLAEVGDIRRFNSPKQVQKLAGLELKENSSGKHKGQTTISKRGRKKLRRLLFQVVLPMIRSNREFREIYDYYTTRIKNPLKGRQAMVAVSCKLIRVFYAVLTKGIHYDAEKLRNDIIRPQELKVA